MTTTTFDKQITIQTKYLQDYILGDSVLLNKNSETVEFQFRILPRRDAHTCKVVWRCDNQTGTLGNVNRGSPFYERLNGFCD